VLATLKRNRGRLDALAAALLEHETLDEEASYAAAGLEAPGEGAGSYAAAARSVSA
jgi:cell division protease FtsH